MIIRQTPIEEDSLLKVQIDLLQILLDSIDLHQDSLLGNIEGQLDSIQCDSSIIDFWKDALVWSLAELQQDSTTQDTLGLESIGGLCAEEYGDGVHWARGTLARFSDERYDDNDGCVDPGAQPRSVEVSSTNIRLSPNPANSGFSILGLSDQDHIIRLYDQSGRIIKNWSNYRPGDRISLDNLPSGLYLVEIIYERTRKPEVKKLVVTKD